MKWSISSNDTIIVYIHWPLKHSVDRLIMLYCKALCQEMSTFSAFLEKKLSCKALYVAGVHLSCIPMSFALDISDTLKKTFNFGQCEEQSIEITSEDSFDRAKMEICVLMGFTRVVVKIYSYLQPKPAIDYLKSLFAFVVVQCSVLPAVGDNGLWQEYIKEVIKRPIDQFSLEFSPASDKVARFMFYNWLVHVLSSSGMSPRNWYNFSFADNTFVYMKNYLARMRLKGFGVDAETFDGYTRYRSEKSVMRYLDRSNQGASLYTSSEKLTCHEVRTEKIMLGFHTMQGVPLSVIDDGRSLQEKKSMNNWIQLFMNKRLMRVVDGKLFLTHAGLGYEEEILLRFI